MAPEARVVSSPRAGDARAFETGLFLPSGGSHLRWAALRQAREGFLEAGAAAPRGGTIAPLRTDGDCPPIVASGAARVPRSASNLE